MIYNSSFSSRIPSPSSSGSTLLIRPSPSSSSSPSRMPSPSSSSSRELIRPSPSESSFPQADTRGPVMNRSPSRTNNHFISAR